MVSRKGLSGEQASVYTLDSPGSDVKVQEGSCCQRSLGEILEKTRKVEVSRLIDSDV